MARRLRPRGEWFTFGPLEVPGFPLRHVRAYVPHGHPRNGTRPALYLFDGQNIYGDEGSFAGGWFAHDAVDQLTLRGHHVPVIVGIDNGGGRRIEELSPWAHGRMGGGGADRFLEWLGGTVVPMVQKEFHLIPGAVGAVVGGSSMGGLAALYGHFKYPDVFGGAMAMSSAFFFGGGQLFDFVRKASVPHYSRVYLDCGGREGGGRMIKASEEMARVLRDRGYGKDRLMWRPDARGAHNEGSWRRRLPKALQFLFRKAKKEPLRAR